MALAIIVTLDKALPDAQAAYAKVASGKALSREIDRLDLAARTAKVPPITSFLSENQSALIEQMKAEGFDTTKMRLPQEQWYPAADGIAALRALITHITANLNNFKQPNPLIKELKAAEALLAAAESAGAKFHFTKANV